MYRTTTRTMAKVALVGMLLPAIASAAPPQGNWRGLAQERNNMVSVRMSFVPNAVRVRFGEPMSCDVSAKLLKEDGTTTIYRFGPSLNGGRFCDGMMTRDIRFTSTDDKRLDFSFEGPRSTWTGELQPQPSP